MRYAIWTAVSTVAQANDDKESLSEQEKKCRTVATGKGWTESLAPFKVPGKSRTRWVELRDAENEIPALRRMLDSAKARKFDILVMYDYNRLRDLLDPVAKTLASYGVQIFSTNQPVEPIPSEEFSPYASDSASMMQGMSQIVSRWQIADLRRKYSFGVPARVRRGLYALKIPYGYKKPPGREYDKNAVPIPEETQSAVVIEVKDLFLSGMSYRNIQAHLNKMGYPTATGAPWARTTIRKMLENPFYAGKVYFGSRRVIRDPRQNTTRVVKNSTPLIMEGKHKPLYSWDEFIKIKIEFERRGRFSFTQVYPFSGLLSCSVCGGKVRHFRTYWKCKHIHVKLPHETALQIIPPAIKAALQTIDKPTHAPIVTPNTAAQIEQLERQRKKIQRDYELEIYSPDEAQQRIKEIAGQIEGLRDNESEQQKQTVAKEVFYAAAANLKELPLIEWIANADPERVNSALLRLIRTIEISPEFQPKVHLIID